jgi:hypothetical protein
MYNVTDTDKNPDDKVRLNVQLEMEKDNASDSKNFVFAYNAESSNTFPPLDLSKMSPSSKLIETTSFSMLNLLSNLSIMSMAVKRNVWGH